MSNKEAIVFSATQQDAIIGHCLQQHQIWDILNQFGVTAAWLIDPPLKDLWKQLVDFKKEFNRLPLTIDEACDFLIDDLQKVAAKRSITRCIEAKKRYPWSGLEHKLIEWAKSRLIFTTINEISTQFNAGKIDAAYDLWQDKAIQLSKIEGMSGLELDGFVSAAERVKEEAAEREKDTHRIIPYGTTFLRDSLVGILPTEVVLVGATSGAGKTQWAKIQAAYTAKVTQKPVHYFALEAEPYEIERRIKFGIMAGEFREKNPNYPGGRINYKNYRLNLLNEQLDPYEKMAHDDFDKNYKNLHTYYKKRDDFGISQLDKEFMRLKGQSSLIVLDHIHFIDLNGENENREMSQLIKRLREFSQKLEIPIICIAHLNKEAERNMGLVPRKEHFQGASDLYKVAITALMLSPVPCMSSGDSKALGKPTFIRVVKTRLDNTMLYDVGCVFYNSWQADYTPYYAVGRLSKGETKWSSLKNDLPEWANQGRIVTDVSDVEKEK